MDDSLKTRAQAPGDAAAKQDLGGHREGHPERLDRSQHGETLVEAEHLARYSWIASQAKGRRVLDAGCGTAYGTAVLAEADAAEVTGVDRARAVLDAARPRLPAAVRLETADLEELPFDDGSFDLVVCFEVLEHLENPEVGLDELTRVLSEGGLLAVSSPNRGVYPPGNPHHIREYTASELGDSLARRFTNVRLLRQHAWQSSAILAEEELAAADSELSARLSKTSGIEPGSETFTVGLASEAELPEVANEVVLGPQVDQRALAEAAAAAAEQARVLHERGAQLHEARQQLIEAERKLAELPALYGARTELEAIKSSPSWRLTAPLRSVKAPLGRAVPALRIRVKRLLSALIARWRD